MLGLLLAAGSGSRINKSFNEDLCKPLIKIDDKCLIEFSMDNFLQMEIDNVVVVVGKYKDEIRALLDKKYGGMNITYCEQPKPIGIINAIMSAYGSIEGEDVALQLSDEIFLDCKSTQMKNYFSESKADFLCSYTYESDREMIKNNYSLKCDPSGVIMDCIEKPLFVDNDMKGTGLCIFSAACMELLNRSYDFESNYPNNLCDLMKILVLSNRKGRTFCVAKQEVNINTVSELEYAKKLLCGKTK